MENRKMVVLAAGFGGIAPNLLKIGILLTSGPVDLPGFSYLLTYLVGLVILSGLGIGTALVLKETSTKKAIFIGLGLPAFFQVSAANVSQIYSDKPALVSADRSAQLPLSFIGIAYADETGRSSRRLESPSSVNTKSLSWKVDGDKIPESVVFYSEDKKMVQSMSIDKETGKENSVTVPAKATSFSLSYKGALSPSTPIDSNDTKISVHIKERAWSGLYQAVGFNKASPYIVETEKK